MRTSIGPGLDARIKTALALAIGVTAVGIKLILCTAAAVFYASVKSAVWILLFVAAVVVKQ